MTEICYTPVGHVRSPYDDPDEVGHGADAAGRVVLDEADAPGLVDLDGVSHVVVLAHLGEAGAERLVARPPHGDREGRTLRVRGLDLVDGTPVLDLKPHVPAVEKPDEVAWGWLDEGRAGDGLSGRLRGAPGAGRGAPRGRPRLGRSRRWSGRPASPGRPALRRRPSARRRRRPRPRCRPC